MGLRFGCEAHFFIELDYIVPDESTLEEPYHLLRLYPRYYRKTSKETLVPLSELKGHKCFDLFQMLQEEAKDDDGNLNADLMRVFFDNPTIVEDTDLKLDAD